MGDILTQILMNKAKADEQIRTGSTPIYTLWSFNESFRTCHIKISHLQ
jgi:hypothetical protein